MSVWHNGDEPRQIQLQPVFSPQNSEISFLPTNSIKISVTAKTNLLFKWWQNLSAANHKDKITTWLAFLKWILWVRTTVFHGPRNFEPSRGIWPLPRNFHVSAEFHGIRGNSAERPNSVILYCCCNCNDSQSIHRQLQRPVDFSDVFWHSLCYFVTYWTFVDDR